MTRARPAPPRELEDDSMSQSKKSQHQKVAQYLNETRGNPVSNA
jgi:hypothetical protein